MAPLTGGTQPASSSSRRIHDVWAWNFDVEFDDLLAAVGKGGGVVVALDIEFPGCVFEDPISAGREVRYWSLQENVALLQPIQLGLAVSSGDDGALQGSWNFNILFDLGQCVYTQESIRFLQAAGLDFPRHAVEGIDPHALAWRLAASPLVGKHAGSPRWVTFSGWYDWGYLLKLLTCGDPLPTSISSFDEVLSAQFPLRQELRDRLPRGSLDSLIAAHGIERVGAAHTAGSDALATLELHLLEASKSRQLRASALDFRRTVHPATSSRLSASAEPFVATPGLSKPFVPGALTTTADFVPGNTHWSATLGSITQEVVKQDREDDDATATSWSKSPPREEDEDDDATSWSKSPPSFELNTCWMLGEQQSTGASKEASSDEHGESADTEDASGASSADAASDTADASPERVERPLDEQPDDTGPDEPVAPAAPELEPPPPTVPRSSEEPPRDTSPSSDADTSPSSDAGQAVALASPGVCRRRPFKTIERATGAVRSLEPQFLPLALASIFSTAVFSWLYFLL